MSPPDRPYCWCVFHPYGPSHLAVLSVFVIGAIGLVWFARTHRQSKALPVIERAGAVVLAVSFLIGEIVPWFSVRPGILGYALPLQLSDWATVAAAITLWTRWRTTFVLTYYWGLVLSTQAMVTPALSTADFPSYDFLAFWIPHVVVIWAAIELTWGRGMRPDWRAYRFTVAVTAGWVAVAMIVNALLGTNYGFLNGKPASGSFLDVLGPWPVYLVPLFLIVGGVWALMTWPWVARFTPRRAPADPRRTPDARHGS